jgi:hypothetical protein
VIEECSFVCNRFRLQVASPSIFAMLSGMQNIVDQAL